MKVGSRKEEIVQEASKLFKEMGYSAVSMRDIAQVMGMKAASLYNHIHSKQEILSILVLDLAREFTRGMAEIKASERSPLHKIQAVIELHIDITVQRSEALAALNNDWMHLENFIEHIRYSYNKNIYRKIENATSSRCPIDDEQCCRVMIDTLHSYSDLIYSLRNNTVFADLRLAKIFDALQPELRFLFEWRRIASSY